MGDRKVIKSISNCPIHHQFRQQDRAGSTAQGTGQAFFSSRKGKQRECIEKKHYKLHASPLLVPTVPATATVVHVAAKKVNYGLSRFAFRMKQRK